MERFPTISQSQTLIIALETKIPAVRTLAPSNREYISYLCSTSEITLLHSKS